jgi:hypothetical protein
MSAMRLPFRRLLPAAAFCAPSREVLDFDLSLASLARLLSDGSL